MTEQTMTNQRLVGQQLLDAIDSNQSHKDNAIKCGYVRDNGTVEFVNYFEALLDARGKLWDNDDNEEDEDEYRQVTEGMNSDEREFFDFLCDEFPDENYECVKEFMCDLDEIGVLYRSDYESRYYGYFDSDEEFAKEFYEGIGDIRSDHSLFDYIDWSLVYKNELSYDFDVIEAFGNNYYFHG